MNKSIRCLVITPSNYSILGQAYPVVYLLHGYSGDFSGWLHDAPQLEKKADTHQIIIVCPDGGYDSWYLDSPVDSSVRYETHITKEIVPYINKQYHCRQDRNGRAIAGLSMGGHGALYLAARNPELFGAGGSMAGGLDLRPFRKNNWDLKDVLGDPDQFWQNWEDNSVVNLVSRLKEGKVKLVIDCGVADFFLQTNRDLHQRLIDADVAHAYTERPGGHSRLFWGNAVDYQLVFFNKMFSK